MKKRVEPLKIIDKKALQSDYIYYEIQSEKGLEEIIPGQFVNIDVKDSKSTFVRRPFSIHNVNYDKNTIELLIKVVGPGTDALNQLQIGENMDVMFPLGNGYNISSENKALLVGGGYGISPLYHVATELIKIGVEPVFLFGARTQTDFILLDKFEKLAQLEITTEDGSLGHQGLVTQHPILKNARKFKKIYTCGPEPMMEAIGKYAESNNIICEASLDHMMGCGFGVCLCCVTKTVNGNEVVCTKGPVFNTKDIVW